MTRDHWVVYEFMVKQFGGISFETPEQLWDAITNQAPVTKRFIPAKTWGMYNIDTKAVIAQGYLCRYGFDLIKVKNGEVTEYYRRLLSGKNSAFVAYDLETLEVIENYKNEENKVSKYNAKTGEYMQANNTAEFKTLPNDFKEVLQDFVFKETIFMYAIKPYGRVVEFYYPKQINKVEVL